MKFRNAEINEVSEIMGIIKEAQNYFKSKGIDQWQNNYPGPGIIIDDIIKGNSYVLLEDNRIIAIAAVFFAEERTYRKIYNGQWLSNKEYAVIHRLAVTNKYKRNGAANFIFKKAEDMCQKKGVSSIRVDTHHDNITMQKLIEKNDFKYCGIIFLEDGSKRLAYEKLISTNAY